MGKKHKKQEPGISGQMAREVRKDLKRIAQKHPELKRTSKEAILREIPIKVENGCARGELHELFVSTAFYAIHYGIREKIMRLREVTAKINAVPVIEGYFRKAEEQHLLIYSSPDDRFSYSVTPTSYLGYAKQVAEEMGILFDETRANKVRQGLTTEVHAGISDALEKARRYQKDINEIYDEVYLF